MVILIAFEMVLLWMGGIGTRKNENWTYSSKTAVPNQRVV
jgi:hypothetical protein